ncbi:hypothetical protein LOAG_03697 [Loa loa]|uniref:Uncharacterized protein n=1 Tax=Loa loa TaxID=7209 RepID=A0A1S0U3I9_LOALO|nr:hypothetical protein LOAG_03697 [Loa loa]EFO24784.1 hypothetical protein LOAG_03697 [Loa loa]
MKQPAGIPLEGINNSHKLHISSYNLTSLQNNLFDSTETNVRLRLLRMGEKKKHIDSQEGKLQYQNEYQQHSIFQAEYATILSTMQSERSFPGNYRLLDLARITLKSP